MKLRNIYLILLIAIFTVPVFSQNKWQKANDLYAAEKYSDAIVLYEDMLKTEGEGTELYYNLGNAYYKEKKYADAILNYERALLISPQNKDAQFNLELAKSQIVDKIEPVNEFFLTMWMVNLRESLSSDSWAIFSIICFLLFIGGVSVYYYTRRVLLKKMGFFGGILFFAFTLVGNIFASEQKEKISLRNEAIIYIPTITIKSTPAESGTDLFILHEGTKVEVLGTLGQWSEIRVDDGNQGWVPSTDIKII